MRRYCRLFPRKIGSLRMPFCLESGEDLRTIQHRNLAELDDESLFAREVLVTNALAEAEGSDKSVHIPEPPGYMSAAKWLLEHLIAIGREIARRKKAA